MGVYTSRDVEDWEETSNTNNPVECINRQSFKSRNNWNVILENIYLENRIHAVKMAASSKDVSITYSSSSNKKNKKGTAQAWSTIQSKKMMHTVHQTKLKTSEQPKDHDKEEKD